MLLALRRKSQGCMLYALLLIATTLFRKTWGQDLFFEDEKQVLALENALPPPPPPSPHYNLEGLEPLLISLNQ